jgi:hypothetical protein
VRRLREVWIWRSDCSLVSSGEQEPPGFSSRIMEGGWRGRVGLLSSEGWTPSSLGVSWPAQAMRLDSVNSNVPTFND